MAKKQKPAANPIKPAPAPARQPAFKTPNAYKTPTISRRPIRQPGR